MKRFKGKMPNSHRRQVLKDLGITGKQHSTKQPQDLTGQEVVKALGLPPEAVRLLPRFVMPIVRRNGVFCFRYYHVEQFTPLILDQLIIAAHRLLEFKGMPPIYFDIRGWWDSSGFNPGRRAVVRPGCYVVDIDGRDIQARARCFRLHMLDDSVIDIHSLLET